MKNIALVDILEKAGAIMYDNPEEALKMISGIKAKELNPEDFYKLTMMKADIFYHRNKFNQAIRYYKKALVILVQNRNEAECYCHIGGCYYEKSQYSLALSYYKKALSLAEKKDRKTLGEIYHGLAVTYIDIGKYDEALEYYMKIIDLYRNYETEFEKQQFENAISSVASCYWKLGNEEKSEEYFQEVISIPNITPWILAITYAHKAHRLLENSQWSEALQCYKKAISLTDCEENKKSWRKYIKICEKQLSHKGVTY